MSSDSTYSYSVRRVLFVVEDTFCGGLTNYAAYLCYLSNKYVRLLIVKIEEMGHDSNDNVAKNMMLFRLFSDTIRLNYKNKVAEHISFCYDFDDFYSEKDWTKTFVEKLIRTGKGQCHSMPLLYLILAEEIGAEAYLAYSPQHSYIKFQDAKGKWINAELTMGILTTNAYIFQSGYVKAEALQNEIYMHPMKKKLVIKFHT